MILSKQDMERAEYLMWCRELNAMLPGTTTRPDWRKRRIAADRICAIVGVKDLIKAIANDGMLKPAPPWPEVDVVPVGGGPGIITCEVRTWHKERGKIAVKIVLMRPPMRKKFDSAQIGEAMERGKHELGKIIAGQLGGAS